MFCWQCEQTKNGTGCDLSGICGKKPEVSDLQDLLRFVLEDLACAAVAARRHGFINPVVDRFMVAAIFSTITNVDFDPARFRQLIGQAAYYRDRLKEKGELDYQDTETIFQPAASPEGLTEQARNASWRDLNDPVVLSLRETTIYGLKGLCAYVDHASILGKEDEALFTFVHECLAATRDKNLKFDDWLQMALKVGEMNIRAMQLLDTGNTETYGHPQPTSVPLGARRGKCILISGHDLADLKMLLQQTEGLGINIYTHGEMLPAHGYPELKKHSHFYGHFGTGWQNQATELPQFPGPVLFTTNCIQRPGPQTSDHTFTTGLVGWPGIPHITADENGHKDFRPVINKALALPGYAEDIDKGDVMVGFGHHAILAVADKLINLIMDGKIRHIFLVAGCDGARPSRSYYSDFVDSTPPDTLILTLACGKFRFFDHKLGEIEGLPRLLDIGQCNDAYSAVVIAQTLAQVLDCKINDLPLSFIISWYEQKACAILLSLLYLGVKNIHLGPSLPAFIHPDILHVLGEALDLKPISSAADDLKQILEA